MSDIKEKFFLFSKEQMDMRIRIESSIGRKYKPGKVMVRGKYKPYTEICDIPKNNYTDSTVVLKGILDQIKYNEPIVE